MNASTNTSALAAYREFKKDVIFTLVAFFLLSVLVVVFTPADDTDQSHQQRSGLRLHTDYGTGCQYLETANGGVTPRLGTDGEPMCTGSRS